MMDKPKHLLEKYGLELTFKSDIHQVLFLSFWFLAFFIDFSFIAFNIEYFRVFCVSMGYAILIEGTDLSEQIKKLRAFRGF